VNKFDYGVRAIVFRNGAGERYFKNPKRNHCNRDYMHATYNRGYRPIKKVDCGNARHVFVKN
jgi:hypothetical protein